LTGVELAMNDMFPEVGT